MKTSAGVDRNQEKELYEQIRCFKMAVVELHEFQKLFFESGEPYLQWLRPSQVKEAVLKFGDELATEPQLAACLRRVNLSNLNDEEFEAIFKVKIGTPNNEEWSSETRTRLQMLSLEQILETMSRIGGRTLVLSTDEATMSRIIDPNDDRRGEEVSEKKDELL